MLNVLNFLIGLSYGSFLGNSVEEAKIFSYAPMIFILSMLGSGAFRNNTSFPFLSNIFRLLSHYNYFLELYFNNEGGEKFQKLLGYDRGNVTCIVAILVLIIILNLMSFWSLKRYAKRLKL
jgi:hypothetical protein